MSASTLAFPERRGDALYAEAVPLSAIAARFGTPCYVYSKAHLSACLAAFQAAFSGREHLICYAVKANSNLAILNLFARLGAGFDIVSGGELQRVLSAGGDPGKTVFSGVGKTVAEIELALSHDILCFNVESADELERLNECARRAGKRAPVSLRINPDVDARTHPYIATGLKDSKFGIAYAAAAALYRRARDLPHLSPQGIDYHIGSTVTELAPFLEAFEKALALMDQLAGEGLTLTHLDIGGGIGIRYRDETPPGVAEYAAAILTIFGARTQKLILEPGRALVGAGGLLLTRVEYLKHAASRNFAVVDAAMNDLIRPALYQAYHEIVPVRARQTEDTLYDVVGPICESGDFLGHDRRLAVAEGDLLAILCSGAYGSSMSSNYNSRPRAAEVMVDGERAHLIRARESVPQLYALEQTLP